MTRPIRYTCEEVFQRLDDFLDRELSAEEMRLVEEHLDTCAQCASEHKFESRLLDDVRMKLGRIAIPADLLERITTRLAEVEQQRRS